MTPDALTEQASTMLQTVQRFVISNQFGLDAAADFLSMVILPMKKEAAGVFDPIVQAAYQSHQTALSGRAKVMRPITDAESHVRNLMAGYIHQQEVTRREEQARLDRLAVEEKRQAEERERLERERLAREAEELVEREIESMEAAGIEVTPVKVAELVEEKARLVPPVIPYHMEKPEYVPAPIVQKTYTMPKGISTRETWVAEVVDLQKLAAFVAATGQISLIEAAMPNLNRMAGALREQMNIPGVRAVKRTGIAQRGGR